MKPIIIDMEEMSDSTEVYATRPSPIFKGTVYTLAMILLLAAVWMYFFQIDVVTHANGVIRNSDTTATLTNVMPGKLTECNAVDGEYVEKGELLFAVDSGEYQKERKKQEQELEKLNLQIDMLHAYQQALGGDESGLQQQKKNPFYEEYKTRYQGIKLNCDSVHTEAAAQRSQYQSSIERLNGSIQSAENDKNKLNQMLSDIRSRNNSFSQDEVYYYAATDEYINRYHLTEEQYDTQIEQLKESTQAGEQTEEQRKDYEDKIEALQREKEQALNQVETEMVAAVEQSLASAENNLKTLQMNQGEAQNHYENLQNGSEEINTDMIIVNEKNAVYAELNTCKSRKAEYEAAISSLEDKIADTQIRAQADGYLNMVSDKMTGDYVGAGENLGSIVPKDNGSYQATIYVENQDIGKIREGQAVKYEIFAYPSSEYGKAEGKIQKISKDMKVNQENGSGYYEVEASISYKGGKKEVEFLQGMAVETKLITGKKNVIQYLLEKIDLLDE